jgi:hypothetical protein
MKDKKVIPYNLRLPERLKNKLEKRAREEKRSLNQQIIFVLERFSDESLIEVTPKTESLAHARF